MTRVFVAAQRVATSAKSSAELTKQDSPKHDLASVGWNALRDAGYCGGGPPGPELGGGIPGPLGGVGLAGCWPNGAGPEDGLL